MMLIWQRFILSRLIPVCLIGLSAFAVVSTAQANHHGHLNFGIHPYLPEKELIQKFSPLNQYLSEAIKKPIKIKIAKDYESHIERIGSDSLDIAYLGPASYIEMTKLHGKHPLLGRIAINGSPTFHGVIIVRADSPLKSLVELKQKRFAFGSVKSTMSYLVPRRMLQDVGITLSDLAEYSFLGNHRNVVLGVLLGEYQAGAVKEAVYEKFRDKGLRVLAQSPPVSEHVFVASRKLNADVVKNLRKAMYALSKSKRGINILKNIKSGVSDIVPVHDKDYDTLRVLLSNVQD